MLLWVKRDYYKVEIKEEDGVNADDRVSAIKWKIVKSAVNRTYDR